MVDCLTAFNMATLAASEAFSTNGANKDNSAARAETVYLEGNRRAEATLQPPDIKFRTFKPTTKAHTVYI